MELNSARMYEHPTFKDLHRRKGSGMYHYTERLGQGGYFYLSSRGAMPYNREVAAGSTERLHDIYDVLRAVESGRVVKLERQRGEEFPVLWAFNHDRPVGRIIIPSEALLSEMADLYVEGVGFDLGARCTPSEPRRGQKHPYKIEAFSIMPRPKVLHE